ncbi:MAG: hypothetical protein HYY97_16635, partial [Rhodocyclales bacterium]|nr:hypothetical protein [Rhodocyclales bacterium]
MIPVGSYYTRDHPGLDDRSRDIARDLGWRESALETLVKQAMLAPGSLMAGGPSVFIAPERAQASARLVFQMHETISRLEFAPEGKSSTFYTRNEAGHGADFAAIQSPIAGSPQFGLESRGDPIIAIDNESLTVTQAMQLRRGRGQAEFWGHVTATIRFAELAKALRLDDLAQQGYSLSLDYFRRETAAGKTLIAAGGSMRDTVTMREIRLPQGDRIQLRASPPVSWNAPPIALPELLLLLAASALVGLLTYLLLRRSAEMAEQVAVRTLQLA